MPLAGAAAPRAHPPRACPPRSSQQVFTEHTHIVAIKTSGNVYCWEAVEQLCLKPKSLRDLITGGAAAGVGRGCRGGGGRRAWPAELKVGAWRSGRRVPRAERGTPAGPRARCTPLTLSTPLSYPTADEPFKRSDIIHLQDPLNLAGRNLVRVFFDCGTLRTSL